MSRILLLAGALLASAAARAQERWVGAELGFRIDLPGAAWRFEPAEGDAEALLVLRIPRETDGPPVGARIEVRLAAGDGGSAAMVEEALARAAGSDRHADPERLSVRLGGRPGHGLAVTYRDPQLGTFRIRQDYVVAQGLRYVLQTHAPVDAFSGHAAEFETLRASFALLPLSDAARESARLRALAARCGSEIEWASDWSAAAARARASGRPVLVAVRIYPGFAIEDELRRRVFMASDVVELVQERFVALRLRPGMPAPFRDHAVYGMSGTTFGSALLVVTADGEVRRETHATNEFAVYDFLRAALAAIESPPASLVGETDLARAASALRRGELARAEALLGTPAAAAEHVLLADLRRRQRRGPEALAALQAARRAPGAAPEPTVLAVAEARLHLRRGDTAAARRVLDALAERNPEAAARPDVRWWRGLAALAGGRAERGRELLRSLALGAPESREAWQAAALLTSTRLAAGRPVRVAWPDPLLLASLRTPAPAPAADLATVGREALAFLLVEQREDGSWVSPSEIRGQERHDAPFVVAITALCARSLLPRSDGDDRLAEAVRAAQGFVLEAHRVAKGRAAPRSFMDYTVWSESLSLGFLAECVAAGVGDSAALRAVMAEKVATLAGTRRPSGGFSYYLTRDLAHAAPPPPEAMSFTTAAVVLGLLRARDEGVAVDDELVEGALDCIERARGGNGAFAYMVGTGAAGPTARPGAAGRGPLCELALLRGGRGSLDRVRGALEILRTHRAGLHAELGKSLMHAGPDGQGCHYLFFDYATAAAAVRALPEPERARHRPWLLELVLPARSVEGGFRDTPINGWAFGTAMALTVLWELREAE